MNAFWLRAAQNFLTVLSCTLAISVGTLTRAADDSDVIQIEEYWELEVGGPDANRSAPQVTMIMSPTESLDGDFFAFTVNHWSYPDYAPGGYQLQQWQGDDCVESRHGWRTSPIAVDGEVITWVQRLSLDEGQVRFQVLSGHSESWGNFGGEGFSLSQPSDLGRLNNYRPATSLNQSGIGYAGNRVSSLTLTRLKWITADGEVHEMVAPIDIDSDLDP